MKIYVLVCPQMGSEGIVEVYSSEPSALVIMIMADKYGYEPDDFHVECFSVVDL